MPVHCNGKITALPSQLWSIFSRPQSVNHEIAFHINFLFPCSSTALPSILGFFPLIAPVGKRLYGKFLVLPGGPVLRDVWSCRVDVNNPYVLVVEKR